MEDQSTFLTFSPLIYIYQLGNNQTLIKITVKPLFKITFYKMSYMFAVNAFILRKSYRKGLTVVNLRRKVSLVLVIKCSLTM